MKLAFCLFKYYPYGGLERDFMKIALECRKRQYPVDVYTMSWDADNSSEFSVTTIPVKGISNHARARSFSQNVFPYLESGNYDLTVGFNRMSGLDVYFAADVCFAENVKNKHHAWYRLTPRYRTYASQERAVFSAEKNTKILLLNESEKKHFMNHYQTQSDRFYDIPPGIDKNRLIVTNAEETKKELRREIKIKDDDFLLLMVGSDFKRKGLDRSLRALAALPPTLRKKTYLCVIGKGDPSNFLRLAKKLTIADNVLFLGGREDVGRFMQAADLLLHPAYVETAGMVLLESIAAGLPLLVTENCGYASHVDRAGAGRIVPIPYNQKRLNQYLLEMLLGTQREKWSANALRYAGITDLYSLPVAAVNLLEKFYREKKDVA